MFSNTVNHLKFHLKPTALTYRFNFRASNALLNQGALSSQSTKNSSRKNNSTFQLNREKIQGRIFFFSFLLFALLLSATWVTCTTLSTNHAQLKANCDLVARVFPRFYPEFSLAHCNIYHRSDWPLCFLWVWLYQT